jgi:transcriptional regulator with XRE-family HTH domain
MRLDMTRKWFESRIAQEGNLEVGAGIPLEELEAQEEPERIEGQAQDDFVELLAFGSLVRLLRRSRGLSVEQLADAARVDPVEILSVECNPKHSPRPRTVHQLAAFFELPERPLVRLSNLTATRSTKLRDAAIHFAAHSSKVMELTREERSALAEFVGFLSSEDAES